MADFTVLGHISTIKYLPESILIYVDEYKKGYRKADGEVVDDKVLSWRCIFSGNASKRNYITKYFSRGSLVQVKGEIVPYAIEHGKLVDGFSVYVQTINLAAYPRQTIKQERKMIAESQLASDESPDLAAYNEPDF